MAGFIELKPVIKKYYKTKQKSWRKNSRYHKACEHFFLYLTVKLPCIDFRVRMIDKYGEEVLRELEEEKQNKEEKIA